MENASKALIIAGAILLAILLISLGIYIFTGAQDVTKKSGLDSQAVSVVNSAISKYEGSRKSASDVRSVRNEILAANKKFHDEGEDSNRITINGGSATDYDASNLNDTQKIYTIKLTYNNDTGYISNVDIN
jgi:hypothetical protein